MNSWMISGIILLIGFFICLVLILRAKWKAGRKNIDDYQKGRDKSTFRKKKKKKESSGGGGLNIGNLIGGFVVILIGFSLLPTIAEEVGNVCSEQLNVSSATNTMLCSSSGEPRGMLGLISIFFALGVVIVAISMAMRSFRNVGLI